MTVREQNAGWVRESARIVLRATRAIVDLDAIEVNVRALRRMVPPRSRLMAVVKADAYGHGAPWVARTALAAGAAELGVATVGEGEELQACGIDAPIVLLGSIDPAEAEGACRAGLQITVAESSLLDAVQKAARRQVTAEPVAVHLKVDTGLRRYGALPDAVPYLATRIANDPYLRFVGLSTHFASADEAEEPFTAAQWDLFRHVVAAIAESGITVPPRHVANSAAILTGRSDDCEIARAGIAIYGVPPSPEVPLVSGMRPAIGVQSRIVRIIPLEPGDTVGYNRTFRAERPGRAALVPIGYADGYRRSLAGRAWMGLGGRQAHLLGRVSMDQAVIEVPSGVEARVGDMVHVLGGPSESSAPCLSEMASLMETNTYEVLVGLRQRVPRIYLKHSIVVGMRVGGQDRDVEFLR